MQPLIKQIEIAYYNCKYFSLYTREVLGCLLGISPSGQNSCGGNYITKIECALWLAEKRAVNTGVTSRFFAVRGLISQAQIWKMFWGENLTNLTNLLYLPISSRVCITVSNYPSPSHVYVKLCKHEKGAFSMLNFNPVVLIHLVLLPSDVQSWTPVISLVFTSMRSLSLTFTKIINNYPNSEFWFWRSC